MDIKPNFKSVVVIGAFNPSILTPDFLRQRCGFDSKHDPEGRTTPVASEITFGNTRFLMELNKFQIVESEPSEFDALFPSDMAVNYLNVLEYTPLNLLGMNLNYSLYNSDTSKICDILASPLSVGTNLGFNPLSVSITAHKPNNGSLEVQEATIVYSCDAETKSKMKVMFESDRILINHNFEIGNLEEDRSKISQLVERHAGFLEQYKSMQEKLFGVSHGKHE